MEVLLPHQDLHTKRKIRSMATVPKLFQYVPLRKSSQLALGTGQIAVVTGWTVKEALLKYIEPHEYAVVGNLYSPTRGIDVLARNLLANPHVHYLVVLNATKEDRNAGAARCLVDFFARGFHEGRSDEAGRPCWVANSEVPGFIDIEVDRAALETLRQRVQCVEATDIAAAVARVKTFADLPVRAPWGAPVSFPPHEIGTSVLPGPRYGHRIEGKTVAETWVKIVHRIKTTGRVRETNYDSKWQELVDLTAIVTAEPEEFYFPEPNFLPIGREFLGEYIAQILDDAPQREGVKYTYGQRLRSWFGRDQIEGIITKLQHDRDSARAVMNLWDARDLEGQNPPCLNHIWARVAAGELSLTATFRSNDMFSAWPANAMGLRALQRHICQEIEARSQQPLALGPLVTVSQSAHIYDDCWDNAERLIAKEYARLHRARDYSDPCGSFSIELREGEIVIEHLTPGTGEVVNCYAGRSAVKLYQQIAADCPGLQVEHALYLGTELQKAETALSLGRADAYWQDRPLKLV